MKKRFLFLDDDAFHPDKIRHPRVYYPLIGANAILKIMDTCEVIKFTTVEGAIDHIQSHGCPDFISFDNDLQRDLEGMDLAKWLVEQDMDNPGFIPKNFQFFVHSQNISAKERIYSYLDSYLKMRSVTMSEKDISYVILVETKDKPKNIRDIQYELVENAFAKYCFGDNVTVSDCGEWDVDVVDGHDDWTCVVSADIDGKAEALSVHVKFKEDTNILEEVYAYLNGNEIGYLPTSSSFSF